MSQAYFMHLGAIWQDYFRKVATYGHASMQERDQAIRELRRRFELGSEEEELVKHHTVSIRSCGL